MAKFASLPTDFNAVIPYLNKTNSREELFKVVQPFIDHESTLRQVFAQQPNHEATQANHLVPVFASEPLVVKARDLAAETEPDKNRYILSLPDSKRRQNGSLATVKSLKDFRTNFSVFSEQSLADLDWSNVVAAGSSVLTPLLPVDDVYNESKRALRAYYHEQLAPASDVDLFLYGLTEDEAVEKIKQIERCVRDSVLSETTTIRTKNAITIVSEYPTRHVQIVLRLYKSITEILTGFDVDCSCVAYDGTEVWASPRALTALATQQNSIDLTRRSPSYENRLSKYSHRGFEVYWAPIDRKRVDPTIYERAFNRVVGLARLLVLEKLPHPSDRDSYADKRRQERGRPELPWNARYRHALPGNVKDAQPDDVPDWLDEENHSEYHTFTIPYGPKYNARKIEKLLFKQDLLLNAEWNRPKERKTKLHRHPAFFGSVDDVLDDCCGFCPKPETDEDLEAHEEESKLYISGKLHFIKEDPGRQAIGSFNPLNADDWTDMAYLGSSIRLCQAIAENDLEVVNDWFGEEGADINRRDHTGRTPLQLACMCSSPDIVQTIIDHGARIVSRIYNGMTALHMAAHRGNVEIVKLLLDKSEENRKAEDIREEGRRSARRTAALKTGINDELGQDGVDEIEIVDEDGDGDDEHVDNTTEGSFVKIEERPLDGESEDEPDVYDVDVLAWDSPVSALHLAAMAGHSEVVKLLVEKYAADAMLAIKIKDNGGALRAILSLVLPMQLPFRKASETVQTLLDCGASPAQADPSQISSLHYLVKEGPPQILDVLNSTNKDAVQKVIDHLVVSGWHSHVNVTSPLLTAIRVESPEMVHKLLELGSKPEIDFETFVKAYSRGISYGEKDPEKLAKLHKELIDQPIIEAARHIQLANIVAEMLDMGVNVNALTKDCYVSLSKGQVRGQPQLKSLLDIVRDQIKELKNFKVDQAEPPVKPEAFPSLSIPETSEGYQSWMLRTSHQQAESIYIESVQKYEDELKAYNERSRAGEAEKQQVIDHTLQAWEALEAKVLGCGAKTFQELHPDVKIENYRHNHTWLPGRSGQDKDKAFENKISFQVPHLTDHTRQKYTKLFEAVYVGDEKTVKSLCLSTENPLQIAVQDSGNFTPFSLAVVRGHYKLANTVLDIAAAQYEVPENEKETFRYSIRRPDDVGQDYDSDGSEDEDNVKVYRELIDEKYTIDDIRVLAASTKSNISPKSLFQMRSELWRTFPIDEPDAKAMFRPHKKLRHFSPRYEDEKAPWSWFNEMLLLEKPRNSFSLFRHAIISNDGVMLKYLLKLQYDLFYRKDDDDTLHLLQIDTDDFDCALRLGRTEMLDDIICSTGTLLPLASLAKKSGIQIGEKPEYYQGLSVHGQKRQDWAQEDRGQKSQHQNSRASPLLSAVMFGNIKTVEYFLSETPLRCYEEFTEAFKHDKHIKTLAAAKGGIERALHSWMQTRTHLAIHMAVMADPAISKPVRDLLIKRMPEFVNSKSSDGTSPLQLALQLKHYEAASELVAAGADQNTRNKAGENLLHTIYINREKPEGTESLQRAIELLNPDVIASLTLQRLFGDGPDARTPLMSYLNGEYLSMQQGFGILDVMMELSKEKDLEVMDAAGDYPLHSLVRKHSIDPNIVRYFANRRPDLLFKENATGTTPIEIVENSRLRNLVEVSLHVSGTPQVSVANLFDKPSERFNREHNWRRHQQYSSKTLHRAVKDLADKFPRRRGLVSVLDANETARRLAGQQKRANEKLKEGEAKGRSRYMARYHRFRNYRTEKKKEKQDEVSLWAGKAWLFRNDI